MTPAHASTTPPRELIELRNAVQTALLVVHAAALNHASKDCHDIVAEDQGASNKSLAPLASCAWSR